MVPRAPYREGGQNQGGANLLDATMTPVDVAGEGLFDDMVESPPLPGSQIDSPRAIPVLPNEQTTRSNRPMSPQKQSDEQGLGAMITWLMAGMKAMLGANGDRPEVKIYTVS